MEFARIAAGDRTAFEALFRAHYKPLCAFANGYLADADKSEDLVQELFIRLWLDREKLTVTSSIKAYLFAAVRNRCLNALKVAVRMRRVSDQQDALAEEGFTEDEHTERIARVQAAVAGLPDERRKVFTMCRFDGLKYAEVAARLGISVKTVENQMGKALKDLRVELADLVPLLPWLFWLNGGDGGI